VVFARPRADAGTTSRSPRPAASRIGTSTTRLPIPRARARDTLRTKERAIIHDKPNPAGARTTVATAEHLANEFLALLDEGWNPDLGEFLQRVPAPLQEEVFQAIDTELAHRQQDAEEQSRQFAAVHEAELAALQADAATQEALELEPEPEYEPEADAGVVERHSLPTVELVVRDAPARESRGSTPAAAPEAEAEAETAPKRDTVMISVEDQPRWMQLVSYLVPGSIRGQFIGEVYATRAQMREDLASGLAITLSTLRELANGIAQHVPLQSPPVTGGVEPERVTRVGWTLWRVSGTTMFAGFVLGSYLLSGLGAVLLGVAIGCVAAVGSERPGTTSALASRFVNAVGAGLVLAVVTTLVASVGAVVLIGLASLLSFNALAVFAMKALMAIGTGTLCGITVSGWNPEPWYPQRLVRQRPGQ